MVQSQQFKKVQKFVQKSVASLSQHDQKQGAHSTPKKYDIVQLFTIYGIDLQSVVAKWRNSRDGRDDGRAKLENMPVQPELLCYIDKDSAQQERLDDAKSMQAKAKKKYPYV